MRLHTGYILVLDILPIEGVCNRQTTVDRDLWSINDLSSRVRVIKSLSAVVYLLYSPL